MGTTRSLVCTYVKPVLEGEVVDVECRVSFFFFLFFLFLFFSFYFSFCFVFFFLAFFLPFFWQYLLVWQIGGTLC